jgi:D-Tyr-tRNAtyr deacylase
VSASTPRWSVRGQIDRGIEVADTIDDANWLAGKLVQMRIFDDSDGKMNLSLIDIRGSALVVSQFTLHSACKKGIAPASSALHGPTRPSPSMNTSRHRSRHPHRPDAYRVSGSWKNDWINDAVF